jgi:hypothetical protein
VTSWSYAPAKPSIVTTSDCAHASGPGVVRMTQSIYLFAAMRYVGTDVGDWATLPDNHHAHVSPELAQTSAHLGCCG